VLYNPSGAVGGERNHKTNNRVRSKLRVRLRRDKCEKQVSVSEMLPRSHAPLERSVWAISCCIMLQLVATGSSNVVIAQLDDEPIFDDDEDDDDFVNDETGGESMLDSFLEQDSEDNDNDEEDEN
jgi:hypothetical protein